MPCIISDRSRRYQTAGFLVCLLSAATLGLGIADVVVNNIQCSQANMCMPLTTGLVLTWVSVGIWASIPIFVTGLSFLHFSKQPADKEAQKTGWLSVLAFMSALFFTPAIIAISIVEVYFKFNQTGAPNSQTPAMIQAIFGLPIAIAVHGFILHLITLHVFLGICCCSKPKKQVETRCPVLPPPKPSCSEDGNADVDRMNIWSAYRWMNVGPSCDRGCAPKPAVSTYYSAAGGAPPSRCFHVGQMSASSSCCHGNPPPQCSAGIYQYPRSMLNAPAAAGGSAVRW